MTRVAFQGELGAFSEEAVRRFFGADAEPVPQREFADVGRAVADGATAFGVLPVENTLAGSVVAAYDVLAAEELCIVGEVIVPIHHCVLGLPGASVQGLRRVISHPVALAQCGRWMRAHPALEAVAVYDTAGAAKQVAQQREPTLAAVAARAAAARYGLALLAENVEDRPDNQTRFLVIVPAGHDAPPLPPARAAAAMQTTLLLETENTPGALVRVLAPFAARGINLCKLESRPTGEPWTYRFFLELDADATAPAAAEALREVEARALRLRRLGTYPRGAA